LGRREQRFCLAALASLGAVLALLPFEQSAIFWFPFGMALVTGLLATWDRRVSQGGAAETRGTRRTNDQSAQRFGPDEDETHVRVDPRSGHPTPWRSALFRPSSIYLLIAVIALLQAQFSVASTPDFALRSSLLWAACAAVAYVFEKVRPSARDKSAWLACLLVAAAVSVLQHLVQPLGPWGTGSADRIEFWGPFRNRNHLAMLAEVIVPLALFRSRSSPRSVLWLLGAALLTSGVVASGARVGSLLLFAEWIVLFAIAFPRSALAFIPAAIAALFIVTDSTPLWQRMREFDATPRIALAQAAIQAVSRSPLVGTGFGSFEAAYAEHAVRDFGQRADHAHNDWLEWGVEGGVWLPLLPLAAFILLIWKSWGVAGKVGLLALMLHSLVDYPFHRPAIGLFLLGNLSFFASPFLKVEVSEQSDSDPTISVR
jgi:O-antigen ligase